jgi:hypothetical protein
MAHALAGAPQGRYLAPVSRPSRPCHLRAGADRPKEVRRKSTIDRKREVAELPASRGRPS